MNEALCPMSARPRGTICTSPRALSWYYAVVDVWCGGGRQQVNNEDRKKNCVNKYTLTLITSKWLDWRIRGCWCWWWNKVNSQPRRCTHSEPAQFRGYKINDLVSEIWSAELELSWSCARTHSLRTILRTHNWCLCLQLSMLGSAGLSRFNGGQG